MSPEVNPGESSRTPIEELITVMGRAVSYRDLEFVEELAEGQILLTPDLLLGYMDSRCSENFDPIEQETWQQARQRYRAALGRQTPPVTEITETDSAEELKRAIGSGVKNCDFSFVRSLTERQTVMKPHQLAGYLHSMRSYSRHKAVWQRALIDYMFFLNGEELEVTERAHVEGIAKSLAAESLLDSNALVQTFEL